MFVRRSYVICTSDYLLVYYILGNDREVPNDGHNPLYSNSNYQYYIDANGQQSTVQLSDRFIARSISVNRTKG